MDAGTVLLRIEKAKKTKSKKFKKQTSVENEEPAEVYNLNFMKSKSNF